MGEFDYMNSSYGNDLKSLEVTDIKILNEKELGIDGNLYHYHCTNCFWGTTTMKNDLIKCPECGSRNIEKRRIMDKFGNKIKSDVLVNKNIQSTFPKGNADGQKVVLEGYDLNELNLQGGKMEINEIAKVTNTDLRMKLCMEKLAEIEKSMEKQICKEQGLVTKFGATYADYNSKEFKRSHPNSKLIR